MKEPEKNGPQSPESLPGPGPEAIDVQPSETRDAHRVSRGQTGDLCRRGDGGAFSYEESYRL